MEPITINAFPSYIADDYVQFVGRVQERQMCAYDLCSPTDEGVHPKPTTDVVPETTLAFDVGYEQTALLKHYSVKEDIKYWPGGSYTCARNNQRLENVLCKMRNESKVFHIDQHCIEHSSSVFSTLESLEKDWKNTFEIYQKYKLVPQRRRAMVCGGGHISLSEFSPAQATQLFRNTSHDFSIPWVFLHPEDTLSCSVPLAPLMYRALQNVINDFEPSRMTLVAVGKEWTAVPRVGRNSVASDDKCRIEFRCFEAPRNWEEFKDHLDFAIAYAKWSNSSPIRPLNTKSLKWLRSRTKQHAIKNFQDVCKKIGLPFERFDKYIRRNLNPRFKYGLELV